MTNIFTGIVLVIYLMMLLGLLGSLVQTLKLLKEDNTLEPVTSEGRSLPSLDIVVPVRNEEADIAKCIESLLAQDYPGVRIIVVNDRSTDGTAQSIQGVQDRHPEVCRVDIEHLPEGLYGKPHAVHSIAGELKGECIAFVDSDLILEKRCLATLVDHMISNELDWVPAMGAPRISLFWERLMVPVFGAAVFAWYDPRKISDPKWDNAIGSALMVCRRDSYEAIGGHKAVIDIYDEDSELIRIAKRSGQKVSFVMTPELYTQRHYGKFADTMRGMTRTFVGGLKTVPRLLITLQALSFVSIVPIVLLILLGVAAFADQRVPLAEVWWSAAVVHLLVSTSLAWMIYHTAKEDRRLAFLHPVSCAVLMLVGIRAIFELQRGAKFTWRGTSYTHELPKTARTENEPSV